MIRKEEVAKYGTWFGKSTPDHIIKRCDEQIANCQKWILNLEQLKQEQLVKKAEGHKEERQHFQTELLIGLELTKEQKS